MLFSSPTVDQEFIPLGFSRCYSLITLLPLNPARRELLLIYPPNLTMSDYTYIENLIYYLLLVSSGPLLSSLVSEGICSVATQGSLDYIRLRCSCGALST